MQSSVVSILNALPWFAWIPIVSIVGGTVCSVASKIIAHRERMAMIQNGIHPDLVNTKPREFSEV
jgi:hypothetical protein